MTKLTDSIIQLPQILLRFTKCISMMNSLWFFFCVCSTCPCFPGEEAIGIYVVGSIQNHALGTLA